MIENCVVLYVVPCMFLELHMLFRWQYVGNASMWNEATNNDFPCEKLSVNLMEIQCGFPP